ncbi:MAG: nickel pincer cofactor biosynthesis protein LarC [Candidatus Dormibacteraeota bacterium]|nr:nickel pincer cofactor biosynthesis protein LarC [Candidatus Dormibacteraeota bacterium]
MTRVAYFDCFSGISGDMVLGALLDAGGDPALLDRVVMALGLEEEVTIELRREERGHIGGQRVVVRAGDGSVRALPELQRLVAEATEIPERARNRTLAALWQLGQAESRLHGVPVNEIHLHELGGADTLVDLAGAFWLLEQLGVEEVYASPLPAERGLSGDLPLPAPAALQLLADAGAVLEPVDSTLELVTPTGAAILAVTARFERPVMRPRVIGYGVGGRDRPGNLLRVWLGEFATRSEDVVTVLETNLDDMAGNLLAALVEDLMQAGALDVSVAPALMKKGRPGHLISVMTARDQAVALTDLLLRRSSTLGVRITETRRVIADRQVVEVSTELGAARVKVKYIDGMAVEWAPEYDDARRLAKESGRELREVIRLVAEAARRA